uniref:Uncharacterized protein n=1 Tax=Chenopodium quinoa TaxID=63459 RepID=A0A803N8Q2_CHEQI
MIATEEESALTTRMGAMVMNEDAQLANMRLLNTSRVEDDDLKGRASPTSSTTNIKQGGSLMIINGEVNEVPTRLLVDTGASHNFLAKEEAKALGVKFTKVDDEMKAINSEATPVYGRAWGVPVRLGKWKGKVDFLVVDIDDEDVVLGMEFLHKVLPFRVSDGMITITSKGSEIGIKLAQLKERDVRVSTLKAWWAPRQRRQGAVHGRIKATKMLGTRHHGVPRDGTTRLKCGVNRRDGAAAHRSTQGTSGALDRGCRLCFKLTRGCLVALHHMRDAHSHDAQPAFYTSAHSRGTVPSSGWVPGWDIADFVLSNQGRLRMFEAKSRSALAFKLCPCAIAAALPMRYGCIKMRRERRHLDHVLTAGLYGATYVQLMWFCELEFDCVHTAINNAGCLIEWPHAYKRLSWPWCCKHAFPMRQNAAWVPFDITGKKSNHFGYLVDKLKETFGGYLLADFRRQLNSS